MWKKGVCGRIDHSRARILIESFAYWRLTLRVWRRYVIEEVLALIALNDHLSSLAFIQSRRSRAMDLEFSVTMQGDKVMC